MVMNATFGPFYPGCLQNVVNHAERLTNLLAMCHAGTKDAAVWLEGRAEEIEAYVANLAHDWRFEHLGELEAVRRLESYLDSVHAGYEHHFGQATCCTDVGQHITRSLSTAGDLVPLETRTLPSSRGQHDTPESPISPR